MKLEKTLSVKNIQTKKFVDGYQLENTEDQQDYKKQMKQINDLIERRYRQGKRTTLLITEWLGGTEMCIDIDKVFVSELEREIKMLERIKSANLDDLSKQEIRQRTYDQYYYYKSLLDLEQH